MFASTHPLRVALADDNELFREGLRSLLLSAGVEVTASCSTADELTDHLLQNPSSAPDIAIIDIQMPPSFTDEGIRCAAALRDEFDQVGILVLSMYVEPHYALAVMSIDDAAIGYLLKDRVTNIDALVDALTRIAADECVIDPHIIKTLMRRPKRKPLLDKLSPRERDVLALMAEGHSNTRISHDLHLSIRSIEDNVTKIFNKLDLPARDPLTDRRVQAVLTWLRGH